ncbi:MULTISPECIES: histone-like nucleoid-structuring protein Lsr2 [Actinoalloteichus]|uniref:Lsr2 n=1 Tax=Actinoalloteichus fjordicus TaxID=1612552 RepID=A0AAC9PU98_9PSEU|nr:MULTISPECIES: Lsr2 family protein [Actinoalloteichus]APU16731.1 Lsr2 [Actinoalloteichus fjordicus]APU22797.1 Lsr2 [Actinoalloteichus sp. GBA129-24]
MAERVCVELVDDLDGEPAQHTVQFALDGVNYEIDLSERNATSLRELLAPYITHGRPVSHRVETEDPVQERVERKKVTDQIRAVAQRSKEQHRARLEAAAAAREAEVRRVAEERAAARGEIPLDVSALNLEVAKPAQEPAQVEESKPAVSLPRFSSANN